MSDTLLDLVKEIFPDGEVGRDDLEPDLVIVRKSRKHFAGETIFLRLITPRTDFHAAAATDEGRLESAFYDDSGGHPWNLQLVWAYHDGTAVPDAIRGAFEANTRFAIRRCISSHRLAMTLNPLRLVNSIQAAAIGAFDRGSAVDSLIDHGFGFLLSKHTVDDAWEAALHATSEHRSPMARDGNDASEERPMIEHLNLGGFRPEATKRSIEFGQLTVIMGRNAVGKTSILDAIATALVGRVRHEPKHARDFPNLALTVKGSDQPLPTSPVADVSARVANWYGYKPEGPAKPYVELYRVNYLEAGLSALMARSDEDVNIEETMFRFLFGDELHKAKGTLEKLAKRASTEVRRVDAERARLQEELIQLMDQKEIQRSVFSAMERTRDDLSPGMKAILRGHDIEEWSQWRVRLETISRAYTLCGASDATRTTGNALVDMFSAAGRRIEVDQKTLRRLVSMEEERGQLQRLNKRLEGIEETILVSDLAAAIAASKSGASLTRFRFLSNSDTSLHVTSDELPLAAWTAALVEKLKTREEALEKAVSTSRVAAKLEDRLAALRAEIRQLTLDYLEKSPLAQYCPACYYPQQAAEIQAREEPERSGEDSEPAHSESLSKELDKIRQSLKELQSKRWASTCQSLDTEPPQVWQRGALQRFRESEERREIVDGLVADFNSDFQTALIGRLRQTSVGPGDTVQRNLSLGVSRIEKESLEAEKGLTFARGAEPQFSDQMTNLNEMASTIANARQTLRDALRGEVLTLEFSPTQDFARIDSQLGSIASAAQSSPVLTAIDKRIDENVEALGQLESESSRLATTRDSIEAARATIGRAEIVDTVVSSQLEAISALFVSFQRPVQFDGVRIDEQHHLRVLKNDELLPLSHMSSGQRASLAIAIFVANNLAHQRAPKIMLMDEPFAHVDDVNVVPLFNLLLDLADSGRRQIVFATASSRIADLFEKKVGSTTHACFHRLSGFEDEPSIATSHDG